VADQGTIGYEFTPDELSLDGFIAGPITDKLVSALPAITTP